MNDNHQKRDKGFTLVELLVALALAGIVSTAIYGSFISQERVYKAQQLVAEMQQNARAAMLIVAKEVRMSNASLGPNGLSYWDATADGGSGDVAQILGFRAYNDYVNGTDAIDIACVDFTLKTPLEKSMPTTSSELDVVSVTDSETQKTFQEGMFAIVTDFDNGDLMELTQVQGDNNPSAAQKLQHNPSAPSGLNSPSGLSQQYEEGDMVFAAKLASFRIIDEDTDHPKLGISLNYNPNLAPADRDNYFTLVNDIEDFQCAYILDDGTVVNEPADDEYDDVVSIRLTIVARTREHVRGFAGSAPLDIEDHDVTNTADQYQRRVLTEEIIVRNFQL